VAVLSMLQSIQQLGYKVSGPDEGPLTVKLPLFCSLRVSRVRDGEYTITPFFGLGTRKSATRLLVGFLVLWFLLLLWGREIDQRRGLAILVMLVAAMVYDVYRYVLTEAAITRVWTLLRSKGS
jgi:hypothetical protein